MSVWFGLSFYDADESKDKGLHLVQEDVESCSFE